MTQIFYSTSPCATFAVFRTNDNRCVRLSVNKFISHHGDTCLKTCIGINRRKNQHAPMAYPLRNICVFQPIYH